MLILHIAHGFWVWALYCDSAEYKLIRLTKGNMLIKNNPLYFSHNYKLKIKSILNTIRGNTF
jgi:hypothetical protein